MKETRDDELDWIAGHFNQDLRKLANENGPERLMVRVEYLASLGHMSEVIARTPVWPFKMPYLFSYFVETRFLPAVVPAALTAAETAFKAFGVP